MRIRERLEARALAITEAMVRRTSEALNREGERIRAEAEDHLAAQCRELVTLSRAVAVAEGEREARVRELERRLERALAGLEQAAPRPLEIPQQSRGRSVAELWQIRE